MTDNERDTHFQGFAQLLIEDLLGGPGYIEVTEPYEEVYKLIAQRAYDLVEYILNHKDLQGCEVSELRASDLPDLTQWPPTQEA